MVLEFLGFKIEAAYYEKVWNQLITHLQDFLLELGMGFPSLPGKEEFILDGDEFLLTWCFTITLQQYFVIIEIKTHKLTHQNLGQLQI